MAGADTKIVSRIKKLLDLAKSTSPHEAASAAHAAAELMRKYNIEEAALRLDESRPSEPIVEEFLEERRSTETIEIDGMRRPVYKRTKRVAWKGYLAGALADSFNVKWFWQDSRVRLFGRPSAIAAVRYMYTYLTREVTRLADEAHAALTEGMLGRNRPKSWKNAYRVGASSQIARRLRAEIAPKLRPGVAPRAVEGKGPDHPAPLDGRHSRALALVEREEEELEEAYVARSKGFISMRPIGQPKVQSAYQQGREAGKHVNLKGGKALKAPSEKLRGGR